MTLRSRTTATALLVSLGIAGGGAAASAGPTAMIAVDRGCYVQRPGPAGPLMITVTGAGFTPGATVAISGDGTATQTVAGATGAIRASLPAAAVTQPPLVQPFTLTATDANGVSASTPIYVTALTVSASPAIAHLRQQVRWTFSGFTPGREIYGHYRHDGRVIATAAYGVAAGPCGTLSTRATEYPGADPGYPSYSVQWDDSRQYSPSAQPRFIAAYDVSMR